MGSPWPDWQHHGLALLASTRVGVPPLADELWPPCSSCSEGSRPLEKVVKLPLAHLTPLVRAGQVAKLPLWKVLGLITCQSQAWLTSCCLVEATPRLAVLSSCVESSALHRACRKYLVLLVWGTGNKPLRY